MVSDVTLLVVSMHVALKFMAVMLWGIGFSIACQHCWILDKNVSRDVYVACFLTSCEHTLRIGPLRLHKLVSVLDSPSVGGAVLCCRL